MASIDKRGDSYRIRVCRGYDEAGKKLKQYVMEWTPPEGMTPKKIEKELNCIATEFEIKCKNGDISAAGDPKLAEFCKTYLEIQENMLAPRTYEYYENLIRDLIVPMLGHIKMSELRPAHVQKFVQHIQTIPKRDGSMPSAATVKRKVACLQSIFRQAVKLQIIKTNPADAKSLTMPQVVRKKVEIITKQEAAKMIECLIGEPIGFQCAIQLAISTGARLGEIVALKFSDFDYDRCRVTFERSAYKVKSKPIGLKPPKDNDVRTVTIYPEVIELVKLLRRNGSAKHRSLVRHGRVVTGCSRNGTA